MGFENVWFWIRPLCVVLLWTLEFFNSVIDNWGFSIIALSVFVRLFTFPISRYGMKQQKIFQEKQSELKPLIDEINSKYKDNSEQSYHETMKLYKEHNFSPFASFKGCLWILVQIPIFIALFQILSHTQEIRGASFLWIKDLSEPERLFHFGIKIPIVGNWFNLLPVVMCAVQVFQAKMMNKRKSKEGGKDSSKGSAVIYILPLSMMILFYQFAAGLLLYWTTTNVCQVFEQWIIHKQTEIQEA